MRRFLTLLLLLASLPRVASAMCDVIPGAEQVQRGALGSLNRPFASPRDLVAVEANLGVCDNESAGLPSDVDDLRVSILYTPPGGFPSLVVMGNGLSGDCSALLTAECSSVVGTRLHCADPLQVGGSPFALRTDNVGRRELFFSMPDTVPLGGTPLFADADPATPAQVDLTGPAKIIVTRAQSGGAAVPIPCGLDRVASTTRSHCDELVQNPAAVPAGLVACIDHLYELDGTCSTAFKDRQKLFPAFTALPEPNRYADVCQEPLIGVAGGVCRDTATELRGTVDAEGNFLMPWDYADILIESNGVPIARVGDGTFRIKPGLSGDPGEPVLTIPRNGFLSSHAPAGLTLPPIFTPISDPSDPASPGLFGTIDARRGVMRIARRSARFGECVSDLDQSRLGIPCVQTSIPGTPNFGDECPNAPSSACQPAVCYAAGVPDLAGGTCTSDGDCCTDQDQGCVRRCGPDLFDLAGGGAGLDEAGTGAFVLTEGQGLDGFSDVVLRQSVPIEGLNASQDLFAFVLSEGISGVSANDDGDTDDFVVTLASRETGIPTDIGSNQTAGVAVARAERPPFPVSAVATEGPYLAFLHSETREGGLSVNGDGDALDYVVRAFRLEGQAGAQQAQELFANEHFAANPFARLDGRPLAISNGKLFFWANELHELQTTTERITDTSTTGEEVRNGLAISGDGRWVLYSTNNSELWVHDRMNPDPLSRVQVDRLPDGSEITGQIAWASISNDGRHIAFAGAFTTEMKQFFFGTAADKEPLATELASPGSQIFAIDRGAPLADGSFDPAVAPKLSWLSRQGDGGVAKPLRCPPEPDDLVRVGASVSSLSDTGRFLVFRSHQMDLLDGTPFVDANDGCGPDPLASTSWLGQDLFLIDRDPDQDGIFDEADGLGAGEVDYYETIERVSLDTNNAEIPDGVGTQNFDTTDRIVSVSGDFVAFETDARLDSRDENGVLDIYVRRPDPDAPGQKKTVWISCPRAADAPNECAVSPPGDSRHVRFGDMSTQATHTVFHTIRQLLPQDTNGRFDIYAWSRDGAPGGQGKLYLVTRSPDGTVGNANSSFPSLTDNGRAVRFESLAGNLVPDDDPCVEVDGSDCSVDIFFQDLLDNFGGAIPNGDIIRLARSPGDPGVGAPRPRRDAAGTGFDGVSLVLDPGSGTRDVWVQGSHPVSVNDPAVRDPDGDATDWVLRIVDLASATPTGPAPVVSLPAMPPFSIVHGDVAFLRSEREISQPVFGGGCSATGTADVDVNGDGDCQDPVVSLWTASGGLDPNVARAGSELSLTPELLAARLNTPTGNRLGVYDRGSSTWDEVDVSAVEIDAHGELVAFLRLEQEEDADLNGDGDKNDRVVGLFQRGFGLIEPPGKRYWFAEEFVIGDSVVAFRTQESGECNVNSGLPCAPTGAGDPNDCDLNDDGDCNDFVMQVYDVTLGSDGGGDPALAVQPSVVTVNTGSTALRCQFEACDPSMPYRVQRGAVRFLTDEAQEGRSLNSDGLIDDIVVQLFSVRKDELTVVVTVAASPTAGIDSDIDPIQPPPGEILTSSSAPGLASGPQGPSQVALTTGLCLSRTSVSCSDASVCDPGEVCEPCAAGETSCSVGQTLCARPSTACQSTSDCAPTESCSADLFVVVAAPDSDGDGFVDSLDNCPRVANPTQLDSDNDGLGEAVVGNGGLTVENGCDNAVCGDGVVNAQAGEECDGEAGCNAACRIAGCFGDIDQNGLVNDDDGVLFFELAGCFGCVGDCLAVCNANPDEEGATPAINSADALALQNAMGTSCQLDPVPQPSACGLLGPEPLLLVAMLRLIRRPTRRGKLGVV